MVLLRVGASGNCALISYFVADCNISCSDAALLHLDYLPGFTALFFPLCLSPSHIYDMLIYLFIFCLLLVENEL